VSEPVPSESSALVLERHAADVSSAIRSLRVERRPVPSPGRGQVLVRVEAAPCNPSDLLFLRGLYGVNKTLPTVPGWEGAGTVVASGGGWMAGWLVGKRVACTGQTAGDGTWAQYYLTRAQTCVPLHRDLDFERGATLIINPLTAIGLMEEAQRYAARAVIQTAGASQVGRMVLRLAADAGMPLVNVVRRDEQVELLRSLGAEHVLDSESGTFDDDLRRLCSDLGVTVGFDAVAGEMTGRLLEAMPRKSTAIVYGALSEQPCGAINPIGVVFEGKRVEGFYLGSWQQRRGTLATLRLTSRAQRLVREGGFDTQVQRHAGLEDAVDALLQYHQHMTDGKVLIHPHRSAG
jgi:NADPH:quinone reductase-like Zn-dependent oxidoreductase